VLGAGLLESAYERCFAYELTSAKIAFAHQRVLPIQYKDVLIDCGFRVDFLIKNDLLVELKAVERVLAIHQAQILTYMKLLNIRQGVLINFNVTRLVDGLRSYLL
jgi:GxxExxY protein